MVDQRKLREVALTPEEYSRVQRHNRVCIDILTRVDFMKTMVVAASDKHAHFETSGDGADNLVMEAHIVAVADAFDAMTSTRSYRRALAQEVAFAELREWYLFPETLPASLDPTPYATVED